MPGSLAILVAELAQHGILQSLQRTTTYPTQLYIAMEFHRYGEVDALLMSNGGVVRGIQHAMTGKSGPDTVSPRGLDRLARSIF